MPPRVPFFDMSAAFEEVGPQVTSRMEAVLAGGRYILGPECDAFEREFADFVGVAGCVGVGNGLDALRLCLTALGIGEGDDVLVPSNTFIATWLAVSAVGARPVPVEPDEEPWGSAGWAGSYSGSSVAMPSGYGPSRGNTTPGWRMG